MYSRMNVLSFISLIKKKTAFPPTHKRYNVLIWLKGVKFFVVVVYQLNYLHLSSITGTISIS